MEGTINFCGEEYKSDTIEVVCQDKKVTDLTPLKGLEKLRRLYLSETQVEDLTPLKGLEELRGLYLAGTQVKDLTPLMELKGLEVLNIMGTKVTKSQVNELRKALPNCFIQGP